MGDPQEERPLLMKSQIICPAAATAPDAGLQLAHGDRRHTRSAVEALLIHSWVFYLILLFRGTRKKRDFALINQHNTHGLSLCPL